MNKSKAQSQRGDKKSFEATMQALENAVEQLENGRLSLDDSLAQFEEGVRHVKTCFQLIENAERKIALLAGVDAEGNPIAEPFQDDHANLDAKAAARGKRRTASVANKNRQRNVDDSSSLF